MKQRSSIHPHLPRCRAQVQTVRRLVEISSTIVVKAIFGMKGFRRVNTCRPSSITGFRSIRCGEVTMHDQIIELTSECLEVVVGGASSTVDPYGEGPRIDPLGRGFSIDPNGSY